MSKLIQWEITPYRIIAASTLFQSTFQGHGAEVAGEWGSWNMQVCDVVFPSPLEIGAIGTWT